MIKCLTLVIVCIGSLVGQARAACVGAPYNTLNFWLGSWHDPASPLGEHYVVRRVAGGCVVEEHLIGTDGQIQGVGVSGWDVRLKQWRQLWADNGRFVTTYLGGLRANGNLVIVSEVKTDGKRWRYRARDIRPDRLDAYYAWRRNNWGAWTIVWSGHFDRIGSAEH